MVLVGPKPEHKHHYGHVSGGWKRCLPPMPSVAVEAHAACPSVSAGGHPGGHERADGGLPARHRLPQPVRARQQLLGRRRDACLSRCTSHPESPPPHCMLPSEVSAIIHAAARGSRWSRRWTMGQSWRVGSDLVDTQRMSSSQMASRLGQNRREAPSCFKRGLGTADTQKSPYHESQAVHRDYAAQVDVGSDADERMNLQQVAARSVFSAACLQIRLRVLHETLFSSQN